MYVDKVWIYKLNFIEDGLEYRVIMFLNHYYRIMFTVHLKHICVIFKDFDNVSIIKK